MIGDEGRWVLTFMSMRIIRRPNVLHFVNAAAFGTSFHRAVARKLEAWVRSASIHVYI
jgi:hypothetical protein